MIATRWKFQMLPLLAALALSVLVTPSAFARETTAASLQADTDACTTASDKDACYSAYAYLFRDLKAGGGGGNTEAMQSTLRTMAETGCGLGQAALCFELAVGYISGDNGWVVDRPRGSEVLERACELGNAESCWAKGIHYSTGSIGPIDKVKAAQLFDKGCVLGSYRACDEDAASRVLALVDAAPAQPTGIEALKSRCADYALDGPSCIAVGVAYQRGSDGAEKNETLSWQYWAKACREISYGPACTYHGLAVLRISDPKDPGSAANSEGRMALRKACELGETDACEFQISVSDTFSFNSPTSIAEANYRLCLTKVDAAHCEKASEAYGKGSLSLKADDYTIQLDNPKATLVWLTTCRTFNTHCVEAADLHLKQQQFALPSPNLAIGILETACSKGDTAACARQTEVVAQTGGVKGSFIDPMTSDDERFMLAKFDLDSGDLDRGRETMQWLANTGHSDAQLELAIAYEAGMSTQPGGQRVPLFDVDEMTSQLYELAAEKGIPAAAMRVAVRKYDENDNEGSDSYSNAIYRANYLGADGAKEFYLAAIEKDKARWEAKSQELQEMNRRNVAARNNMDRQTVQRAWELYAENQKKAAEAAGGEVCGRVMGQGNYSYRTCMSRDHALKYYRGNF